MLLNDREHLPKIVTDIDGIRDILLALDPEIVLLREDISQLIKELYVSTTEKYITRWEEDFSLPYDGSLTLEQRRQRVKNKLARKKVLNWQNLRLLIKNNIVKPRFYIVNEAENYHFKIFLEQQPQRQEFDLSKFTVVGTPTITNDGVASGFSNTSFIRKTLETPLTQDDNFKISLSFTTSSVDTQQQIVSFNGDYLTRPRVYIDTMATLRFVYLNSSGTEINYILSSVSQNTRYDLEIINRNGNLQILVNGTDKLNTNNFSCSITGLYSVYISNWFTGSIDLKQFSITVDGKEVFSGIKNIDYITNELRTSLKQAKPAYLTFDLIVTEFFNRYCGTFNCGTEPL